MSFNNGRTPPPPQATACSPMQNDIALIKAMKIQRDEAKNKVFDATAGLNQQYGQELWELESPQKEYIDGQDRHYNAQDRHYNARNPDVEINLPVTPRSARLGNSVSSISFESLVYNRF